LQWVNPEQLHRQKLEKFDPDIPERFPLQVTVKKIAEVEWRQVTAVMSAAGLPDGPHRCPKGLRHGFAIQALSKGVPLNMVSKWMGHAQMETAAIYEKSEKCEGHIQRVKDGFLV